MDWVYLSPHFDDIALSCGGLVWEQAQAGKRVEIWTICAGHPGSAPLSPFAESLHQRWQADPSRRRAEDIASSAILGAGNLHFSIPDCIYRTDEAGGALYDSERSLFGKLHPLEDGLDESLCGSLERAAVKRDFRPPFNLVSPLTLGGHVDHQLARRAAEMWLRREPSICLWYYADYPYAMKEPGEITRLREEGWLEVVFPVSETGIQAWAHAVAAHASQISTFWTNRGDMRAALKDYLARYEGVPLWLPPQSR